jgi:hypothetical protein
MKEKPAQEYLFQLIKGKLQPGETLIDIISGILHVSTDSAYRRVRGETPLLLDEARTLCNHFKISLDRLFEMSSNAVVFHPVLVSNKDYTFENYLADLRKTLNYIASFKEKEIIYLSKDIPFFHYFSLKPLFAFRYFFWMKSILQHPDFKNRVFSVDYVTPAMEEAAQEISRCYKIIPSTEIWNTEGINSFVAQVEYYREAGYFASDNDAAMIYSSLTEVVEHIRSQAQHGCKYLPGENPDLKQNNYKLFYNHVVIGDNTILVTLNGKKTVYINYDVLNYMTTEDEGFCNETSEKMQTLMRRATILSDVSEKQRNIFFNTVLKRIPFISSETQVAAF